MDKRISIKNKSKFIIPSLIQYLRPGCGIDESSFPRDLKALISYSNQYECETQILDAALDINENQPMKMISKLEALLGDIRNMKIAVLGIAIKPNTDEIKEAPGIKIIRELLNKGAVVYATDPQAIPNARRVLGEAAGLKLVKNHREALRDSEAVLLITAWDDYKKIKPKDFTKYMKRAIVIDGRRVYDKEDMESFDVIYTGIGIDK